MRVRRWALVLCTTLSAFGSVPSRAANGAIAFTSAKAVSVSFQTGPETNRYYATVFATVQNVAYDDELAAPDPHQFSETRICVALYHMIQFGSYSYQGQGTSGCGKGTVTMDDQQTTARIKGTIKTYFGSVKVDVTTTEAGQYIPYMGGVRRDDFSVVPNTVAPQDSAYARVEVSMGAGLSKPATAKATITSTRIGSFKNKRGSGSMYRGVTGEAYAYQY